MPPKLHPLTEKYPPMEADEFAAFKADLAEHGQKNPIWLFEGKVLDGRNRLRACHELGLDPVFAEFTGTEAEAVSFVDSQNLHRRHLSREWRQQRVRDMRSLGMSFRAIANKIGVDVATVHRDIQSGVANATPELSSSEPISGVANATPESPIPNPSLSDAPDAIACRVNEPQTQNAQCPVPKPAREPQRVKGRDGKSYQAQRPAGPKPKPAPPAKAQWTELASILSELAQKVENLVPTPEENDRPWELIKSLETTAASLLRQAERLRRRNHL